MGLFDSIFRRNKSKLTRLLYPRPDDQAMWQMAQKSRILPSCNCLAPQFEDGVFGELELHSEVQDTQCEAWRILDAFVEKAISDQAKEFSPGLQMQPEQWGQIVTLPASIAQLKSVRRLYLYGSHLVRIPVEIGEMEKLEEFDAYTSYRLHWLPYEITRCKNLVRSRMSTRALYGNYKYRPPFPRLRADSLPKPPGNGPCQAVKQCSVCLGAIRDSASRQVWISLRVAADVMPLLVNVCSDACIERLPPAAKGYAERPHLGGLGMLQPPSID